MGSLLGAQRADALTPTTISWFYDGTNGVNGTNQYWVVPADVFLATFHVDGAQGGASVPGGDPGGWGGEAVATIAVTPGEALQIDVGGHPHGAPVGPIGSQYVQGGFNGGGDGGAGAGCSGCSSVGPISGGTDVIGADADDYGGAGGGTSGVYRAPYALDDTLLTGGGGGGIGSLGSLGGSGGGGASASQYDAHPFHCGGPFCPLANTPGAPGGAPNVGLPLGGNVPGQNGGGSVWDGTIGEPTSGDCAPPATLVDDECFEYVYYTPTAGGGGGGGYYGGGGGQAWYGWPYGDGGGGGSSFGPPGAVLTPGVEGGEGYVSVTYSTGLRLSLPGYPSRRYERPTALAGPASALVGFAAPHSGLPIGSYRVTAYPAGFKGSRDMPQATGSRTPITVRGLTDGTTYTFRVSATNERGTGPLSGPSNAVTPASVPGAPTKLSARGGALFAVVTFTAPASPRWAPISSYTVVASPGGVHGTGRGSPITVGGLTGDKAYRFKVFATNRIGAGPPAVSNPTTVMPVTPVRVPAAPSNAVATAGNGAATVSFSAPANKDVAAIKGYTVTASPGGEHATGTASPITVTGLTNGTSYTFTVTATNFLGTGPPSVPSNAVTPASQPPTYVNLGPGVDPEVFVESDGTADIVWTASNPKVNDFYYCRLPRGARRCANSGPVAFVLPNTLVDAVDARVDVFERPSGTLVIVAGGVNFGDAVWTSTDHGATWLPSTTSLGSVIGNQAPGSNSQGVEILSPDATGSGVEVQNGNNFQFQPFAGPAQTAFFAFPGSGYNYGGGIAPLDATHTMVAADSLTAPDSTAYEIYAGAPGPAMNGSGGWSSSPTVIGSPTSDARLAYEPGGGDVGVLESVGPPGRENLVYRQWNGRSFDAPVTIEATGTDQEQVFENGPYVHAVFAANGNLLYSRSDDHGQKWGAPIELFDDSRDNFAQIGAATDGLAWAVLDDASGDSTNGDVLATPLG